MAATMTTIHDDDYNEYDGFSQRARFSWVVNRLFLHGWHVLGEVLGDLPMYIGV